MEVPRSDAGSAAATRFVIGMISIRLDEEELVQVDSGGPPELAKPWLMSWLMRFRCRYSLLRFSLRGADVVPVVEVGVLLDVPGVRLSERQLGFSRKGLYRRVPVGELLDGAAGTKGICSGAV